MKTIIHRLDDKILWFYHFFLCITRLIHRNSSPKFCVLASDWLFVREDLLPSQQHTHRDFRSCKRNTNSLQSAGMAPARITIADKVRLVNVFDREEDKCIVFADQLTIKRSKARGIVFRWVLSLRTSLKSVKAVKLQFLQGEEERRDIVTQRRTISFRFHSSQCRISQ